MPTNHFSDLILSRRAQHGISKDGRGHERPMPWLLPSFETRAEARSSG
jgi:hypothetical protein